MRAVWCERECVCLGVVLATIQMVGNAVRQAVLRSHAAFVIAARGFDRRIRRANSLAFTRVSFSLATTCTTVDRLH